MACFVGALLCAIARRVLHIPCLRYVDDFFGPEVVSDGPGAKEFFARRARLPSFGMRIRPFACGRLVRTCLGQTAISPSKLADGNPLVILGVNVHLGAEGATFWPSGDKVEKWLARINEALWCNQLSAGDASKLSGALQWGSQFVFRRLGRAMVRPLCKQARSRHPRVDAELRLALEWWKEVLRLGLKCVRLHADPSTAIVACGGDCREMRRWRGSSRPPVHLFCDARSTPPRVAAVLFRRERSTFLRLVAQRFCSCSNGKITYADMQPAEATMAAFKPRGDNQIMSLEILSIALGELFLRGRLVPFSLWQPCRTFVLRERARRQECRYFF